MALLGRWTGGVIGTMQPGTSYAAPNGLFPTQDRNDSSTYTWTSSTSTVGVPASGLPDGYILKARFEFEDSSNGRHNPMGKFVQASGTSDGFVSMQVSGFNRDNSEDRSFVNVSAIVAGPSASSTFQFQWIRDTDAPGASDGTISSTFEIIPIWFSNIGMYNSTATTAYTGTTPNQVTLGVVYESDTAAIQLASNEATIKTDNKRYLILGGYMQAGGATRTQKVTGITYDGTVDDATRGYSYIRQAANEYGGSQSWDIANRVTTDIDVGYAVWSGDSSTATDDDGSYENIGPTSLNSAHAGLVIVELNDTAEVFRSHDNTGLQSDTAGTPVDLNAVRTMDFADVASFTKDSNTGVNVEQDMDAFVFGNVWTARQTVSNTARRTTRTHITVNGVEQDSTMDGSYSRGDQSTSGTFAGGSNPAGFLALSLNQDIGMSQTAISGSEGGNPRTQAGTVGLMGINLDTMEAAGGVDGISGVVPTSFRQDDNDVVISGLGFNATQSTGKVWISDATTLAGSANEVDISSAITAWADDEISLDLTDLSNSEIQTYIGLAVGTQYLIVVNSDTDEYGSSALTVTAAPAAIMSLGGETDGAATTSRLSGLGGTFVAGEYDEVSGVTGSIDITSDNHTELVYSVELTPYAEDGADYNFRIKGLDTYDQIATITVGDAAINMAATGRASTLAIGDATIVVGGVNLTATGRASSLAIGNATASVGAINAQAYGYQGSVAFGTPGITLGALGLTTSSYINTVLFGAAALTLGAVSAQASSYVGSVQFGTATLDMSTQLPTTSRTSTLQIGDAGITLGGLDLATTSRDSSLAFGSAGLTLGGVNAAATSYVGNIQIGDASTTTGSVTVTPTGRASTLGIGNASISIGALSVAATGYASEIAIGDASISLGALNLSATGRASTLQFGDALIDSGTIILRPDGRASTLAFGTASAVGTGNINLSVSGRASTLAFGDAGLSSEIALQTSSYVNTVQFGAASITQSGLSIGATSRESTLAFGDASTTLGAASLQTSSYVGSISFGGAGYTLGPVSIGATSRESTLQFGDASTTNEIYVAPDGRASTLAFGDASITLGALQVYTTSYINYVQFGDGQYTLGEVNVAATSRASTLQIGDASVTLGPILLSPSGRASTLQIGDATAYQVLRLQATSYVGNVQFGGASIAYEVNTTPGQVIIIDAMPRLLTIEAKANVVELKATTRTIYRG